VCDVAVWSSLIAEHEMQQARLLEQHTEKMQELLRSHNRLFMDRLKSVQRDTRKSPKDAQQEPPSTPSFAQMLWGESPAQDLRSSDISDSILSGSLSSGTATTPVSSDQSRNVLSRALNIEDGPLPRGGLTDDCLQKERSSVVSAALPCAPNELGVMFARTPTDCGRSEAWNEFADSALDHHDVDSVDHLASFKAEAIYNRERVRKDYSKTVQRLEFAQYRWDTQLRMVQSWALLFHFRSETISRWVNSRFFQAASCTFIVVDSLLMGTSTGLELNANIDKYNLQLTGGHVTCTTCDIFAIPETIFAVTFTSELMMRIFASGCGFVTGPDKAWNLLDTVMVVASVTQLVLLDFAAQMSWVRSIRMLRVVRALRMMRILRYVQAFRHLRLMTLALVHSAVKVMWAVLLIMVVTYLFSIIFLQGVSIYISEASFGDSQVPDLLEFFGSLQMAILTLFMSISGGVSWWDVVKPLMAIHTLYVVLFVAFVVVMLLAAMNIITGIFVNDALEVAQWDKDFVEMKEKERTKEILSSLRELFEEADLNQSGKITSREFQTFMNRGDVRAILSTLGLEVPDAEGFFEMLDVDHSGEIEIDEFVVGCMRFRGLAKTVDIETMVHENKRILAKVRKGTKELSRVVARAALLIEDHLNVVEQRVLTLKCCPADEKKGSGNA